MSKNNKKVILDLNKEIFLLFEEYSVIKKEFDKKLGLYAMRLASSILMLKAQSKRIKAKNE